MVERQNIFPEALSKRVVKGHLLYAPVVAVVPGKLVTLLWLSMTYQARCLLLARNGRARTGTTGAGNEVAISE